MMEAAAETILLVEDEDAVRAVVSAILRRKGYEVLEAPRPSVACEIFDRRGPDIDLLVTDVVMPEMNGGALAERLIARRPELRVLFMSGYMNSTTEPSVGSPNTSFLPKPFHAATLTERVAEILGRRS